nr:vegetative cell wall protein gp1-like [Aegilops tauschii subsp. strangulata]
MAVPPLFSAGTGMQRSPLLHPRMRASARARLRSAAGSRKPARSLPPRARAGRLPRSAASRSSPARSARTSPGNPVNASAHQRAASPSRAPWPAARVCTAPPSTACSLLGPTALAPWPHRRRARSAPRELCAGPASYASAPELFSARTRPSRWLHAPQHPISLAPCSPAPDPDRPGRHPVAARSGRPSPPPPVPAPPTRAAPPRTRPSPRARTPRRLQLTALHAGRTHLRLLIRACRRLLRPA